MSLFARELEDLMREKKIKSAAELSRLSNVDPATLSRVRAGEQTISLDDLDRIAAAIGQQPMIHARLLRARLTDDLRPPGGNLINIELNVRKNSELKEDALEYLTILPPRQENNLRIIAKHLPKSAHLRNAIDGLANLFNKQQLGE